MPIAHLLHDIHQTAWGFCLRILSLQAQMALNIIQSLTMPWLHWHLKFQFLPPLVGWIYCLNFSGS